MESGRSIKKCLEICSKTQFFIFQQCTLKHMLDNFDCVVQAPTGSGKSLAFLMPALQLLLRKRKQDPPPSTVDGEGGGCQVLALVVAPGRELVTQLWHLFQPLCKTLGMNAMKLHGAGGERKKRVQDPRKHFKGQCILITTPGRFEHYLEKDAENGLKQYLKHLEVLIIDEADRYSDRESMRSLTTLLSVLHKQRRTALFSATQTSAVDQLIKFGLRNPVRLTVSGKKVEKDEDGFDQMNDDVEMDDHDEPGKAEHGQEVMPKELSNYYVCVPAEQKLLALFQFLRSHPADKVLVFVSNASQAEYFALVVPPLLADEGEEGKTKRPVLSLHRKMSQARQKVLEQFRSAPSCVLFTTDLLARGVDVVGIHWVLQFDIPKLSKLFIHRCGRAGRMGHRGQSLLLLMPEERAYVQYMEKHEGVKLELYSEMELENGEAQAEKLRLRGQQMAIEDRKILELGSSAFVSYIEAYNRHDCQVICRVKMLDIVGLAHAFALLRLPRIREFQHRAADLLAAFRARDDVRTAEIAFRDPKLEARRQAEKQKRMEEKQEGRNRRGPENRNSRKIKFDDQEIKEEEGEDDEKEEDGDEGEDDEEEEEMRDNRKEINSGRMGGRGGSGGRRGGGTMGGRGGRGGMGRVGGERGSGGGRTGGRGGRGIEEGSGRMGSGRMGRGGGSGSGRGGIGRGGGRYNRRGGGRYNGRGGGREEGSVGFNGRGGGRMGGRGGMRGMNRGQRAQRGGGGMKRARKPSSSSEWDQLQRGERMLKKFKRGKLDKGQLNERMDEI